MIIDQTSLLQELLKQQLKVSHLEKKVDCAVVEASKLNPKMKEAITKARDSEFLKEPNSYILGFVQNDEIPVKAASDAEKDGSEEENAEKPEDDAKSDDGNSQKDAQDDAGDVPDIEDDKEPQENPDDSEGHTDADSEEDAENAEDAEDDSEEDKKKDKKDKDSEKEELNESVKITDLTSKMCSSINCKKTGAPKKAKKSKCVAETEVKDVSGSSDVSSKKKRRQMKRTACPMYDPTWDEEGGGEGGGEIAGGVEEAETQATGGELKTKVQKCVEKIFASQQTDSNKIEMIDIPEMGANVYFCKITFGKTQDTAEKK